MTFDRYLLRSFFHIFVVCFITTFGLIVVIDLFENLDDFLAQNRGQGAMVVWAITRYYGFQAIFFFGQGGALIALVSVVVVLILFQRSGELHPLLAAGVPMYRLLIPLVVGVAAVNLMLVFSQEFVIPQFSTQTQENRGTKGPKTDQVESVVDHETHIAIGGKSLKLAEQQLEHAVFILPAGIVAAELTILEAQSARFHKASGKRPAGWLLDQIKTPGEQIPLTEFGESIILSHKDPNKLFVASDISADQLYKRGSNFSKLSIRELVSRIHCEAFGARLIRQMISHLHLRLMQPFVNVIAALIVIPLMVRRESKGLVADSAMCGLALVGLVGITQGFAILGANNFVAPELAAWAPVVCGGTASAWLTAWIRS